MSSLSDVVAGSKGSLPTCARCGTTDVVRDAFGRWCQESGQWVLLDVYDSTYCRVCEESTEFVWIATTEADKNQIRFLNDQFRRYARGQGSVMITNGVTAEGEAFMLKVAEAVKTFDQFTADNDPHGEHDFGAIEVNNQKIFWKFDYYDKALTNGSPDPTDEQITHRVLTIMLANEY